MAAPPACIDVQRAGAPPAGHATAVQANIEAIADGRLFGWLWNAGSPSNTAVHLAADGVYVGSTEARLPREDLAAASIGSGAHAFEFVLPAVWRDGRSHRFTLVGGADDLDTVYASADLPSPSIPSAIDGRAERISDATAWGWALDRLAPHGRLRVVARAEGVVVGTAVADRFRADLAEAGVGDGRCGFVLKLAPSVMVRSEPVEITFLTNFEEGAPAFGRLTLPPAAPAGLQPSASSTEAAAQRAAAPSTEISADHSSATKEAIARFRTLPQADLFLHAKHRADMGRLAAGCDAGGLTLSIAEPEGWVRVLRAMPHVRRLLAGDWHVRLAFSSTVAGTLHVHVLTYGATGTFSLLHRVAKLAYEVGGNAIDVVLRARALQAADPDLAERPTFLCIETTDAIAFEHLNFHVEERAIEPERVPFRSSEWSVAADLAALNDRMTGAGERDVDRWTLDMADVAIRAECFETASRLLGRFKAGGPTVETLRTRYLTLFAEVAFAEGRLDDLRDRLMAAAEQVAKDDRLFTALSLCFPATGTLADYFALLPSGRPNRSYLARGGLTSAALRGCLNNSRDFEDGQTRLLLASLTKDLGPACWTTEVNGYFDQFDLLPIDSADVSASNILGSIRFARSQPASLHLGRVSVIVSAFNAGQTIDYAIRSILDQTYEDVELLVCDDVSTDDTLARLRTYKDHPKVRVYQSLGNQGPYNIRNALMREATGKYVTFQDADDLAHPERIERQVSGLVRAGKRACVGRWIRVRPNGDVVFFRDHRCLRLCVVSLMAERSLFAELGGYRTVLCGADSELFERLRLSGGRAALETLEAPLILGLWSSQSLTRQTGLEATEDGYRSPARRAYAEAAGRHRLLGADLAPSSDVDRVVEACGISRAPEGVRPVGSSC